MLEAYEMKVLRKIDAKQKQTENESKKSENPAVSNQLMTGWEEEIGTNM